MEPGDDSSMHIPTASPLHHGFTSTLGKKFSNGELKTDTKNNANDDMQRQPKASLDYGHPYIVENQQTPKLRPIIQR